jgi:hypothetical protein
VFYTIPVTVVQTKTFTSIAIVLQAAVASSSGRLGIWNTAADGGPGTLVLDAGTFATTSTGNKIVSISQSLAPGEYWLGVAFDHAVTFYALPASGSTLGLKLPGTSPTPVGQLTKASVGIGAFGDNTGVTFTSGSSGTVPIICIQ